MTIITTGLLFDVSGIPEFREMYEDFYSIPPEIVEFWSSYGGATVTSYESLLVRGVTLSCCFSPNLSTVRFVPALFSEVGVLYLHAGGLAELCEHLDIKYPSKEVAEAVTEIIEQARVMGLDLAHNIRGLGVRRPELAAEHLRSQQERLEERMTYLTAIREYCIGQITKGGTALYNRTQLLSKESLANIALLEKRALAARLHGLTE